MDAPSETKVCPMCAETIKATAKVCPHCGRQLGRSPFRDAFFAWLLFSPFVIAVFGGLAWLSALSAPGRSFEAFQHQIVVLDTTRHYGQSASGSYVSVIGFLRNDSPYAWRSVQLEVQYLDQRGQIIDTFAETLSRQRLPPGATQAFRLRSPVDRPESDYVSHRVFVRGAQDASRRL